MACSKLSRGPFESLAQPGPDFPSNFSPPSRRTLWMFLLRAQPLRWASLLTALRISEALQGAAATSFCGREHHRQGLPVFAFFILPTLAASLFSPSLLVLSSLASRRCPARASLRCALSSARFSERPGYKTQEGEKVCFFVRGPIFFC